MIGLGEKDSTIKWDKAKEASLLQLLEMKVRVLFEQTSPTSGIVNTLWVKCPSL